MIQDRLHGILFIGNKSMLIVLHKDGTTGRERSEKKMFLPQITTEAYTNCSGLHAIFSFASLLFQEIAHKRITFTTTILSFPTQQLQYYNTGVTRNGRQKSCYKTYILAIIVIIVVVTVVVTTMW